MKQEKGGAFLIKKDQTKRWEKESRGKEV